MGLISGIRFIRYSVKKSKFIGRLGDTSSISTIEDPYRTK